MKARHDGHATHYSHANGKGILSHGEFLDWCMMPESMEAFLTLYFNWAMNRFNRWDSPSIDRVDPNKGYIESNIQWLSFAENCEKNHKDPITHREMHL
jgi:hypothetical protein